MAKTGQSVGSIAKNSLTMFHQVMYFLVLQEEMNIDQKNFKMNGIVQTSSDEMKNAHLYPTFLPEEEVQKVIFDNDYLNYIENKRQK